MNGMSCDHYIFWSVLKANLIQETAYGFASLRLRLNNTLLHLLLVIFRPKKMPTFVQKIVLEKTFFTT